MRLITFFVLFLFLSGHSLVAQEGFEDQIAAFEAKFKVELVFGGFNFEKVVYLKGEESTKANQYLPIFFSEFQYYPDDVFVRAKVDRVVFCKQLMNRKAHVQSAPGFGNRTMFFDVEWGAGQFYYLRRVVHHEFFHQIDWADDGKVYVDKEWDALNREDFRYGTGGYDVQDDPRQGIARKIPGFMNLYSQSGIEEDKAEIFSYLMADPNLIKRRTAGDDVIARKTRMMKRLLKSFCPSFDEAFWKRIETVDREAINRGDLSRWKQMSSARNDSLNRKPNFVLIIADDLGYGELGCQGNVDIPTPNIDSIATNGVRFTSGYVTASYCSASRAGLMTGRIQTRFGHEFNPTGAYNEDPEAGLPVGEQTIGDLLTDAGYVTGLVGKWHLGGTARYHPQRRGFDEFFGFTHEGHYFVPPPFNDVTTWLRRRTLPGGGSGRWESKNGKTIYSTHMGHNEPDYDANNPIVRSGQPVTETEYLTDAFTREAVDFVARNHDRPFFLCLSFNAVHSPLQAKDSDLERFKHIPDIQRRIFAAMLANMDDGVGKVLNSLSEHKIDKSTLVMFLSDNGGPTKELTSSNLPLKGGKGTMYEGGIRVPFLMQWKSKIEPQVFNSPVVSVDLFETMANVAGVKRRRNQKYDGVDLLPYLDGKVDGVPHEQFFWRAGTRTALRDGDWKLVKNPKRGAKVSWEVYNLAEDISETKDLSQSQPEKRDELIRIWDRWNSEMVEPVWTR